MNHRWDEAWPSGSRCLLCGLTAPMPSVGPPPEAYYSECPGPPPVIVMQSSTEVLTRITEDLWVNPTLVAAVKRASAGDPGYHQYDPNMSVIYADGRALGVDLPLHEVVALLNGSA